MGTFRWRYLPAASQQGSRKCDLQFKDIVSCCSVHVSTLGKKEKRMITGLNIYCFILGSVNLPKIGFFYCCKPLNKLNLN